MAQITLHAQMLEAFTGTGTSGTGHNGWRRIDGSAHTVVATTDGGTPTIVAEWSLDAVTVAATDNLTPTTGTPATASRSGQVWRYCRANVTVNGGANILDCQVASH